MRGNKNWEEIRFPGDSDSKESTCNVGDLGSIPGLGRFPGGGHGNPLQYSCLENPHGQRSLVGYRQWGCKELDTTERLSTAQLCFRTVWSVEIPHTRRIQEKVTILKEKTPLDLFWGFSAAAKSLQSCPTLCDPLDGSPPGSHVPGILQARTLEWAAIAFSGASLPLDHRLG